MKNTIVPKKYFKCDACCLYIVVILSITLGMSLFLHDLYLSKTQSYVQQIHKRSTQEHLLMQKRESAFLIDKLVYKLQERDEQLRGELKKEYKAQIDLAYDLAYKIRAKYKHKSKDEIKERIKDALSQLALNKEGVNIFLKDSKGNVLLGTLDDHANTEYRDIDLEELQKVRKDKKGYLEYMTPVGEKELVYLKNLDIYDLYIGSTFNMGVEKELLKSNLLKQMQSIPISSRSIFGVFTNNTPIYLAQKMDIDINEMRKNGWYKFQNHHYYIRYYKNFDWYLVGGFKMENTSFSSLPEEDIEKSLRDEFDFVIISWTIFVTLTLLLYLVFIRKVNKFS